MANHPNTRPASMPGTNQAADSIHEFLSVLSTESPVRSSDGPKEKVSQPPARPKIHHGNASFLTSDSGLRTPDLRIKSAREGVMVRALSAEMMVEAAIVTANC